MNPQMKNAPAASEGKKDWTRRSYTAPSTDANKFRRWPTRWPEYESAKKAIARVAIDSTDYITRIRRWLDGRRL